MRTFCRGANIRALFDDDFLPTSILRELRGPFQTYFGRDFRGSLVSDLLSVEAQESSTEPARWEKDLSITVLQNDLYECLAKRLNYDSAPMIFSTVRGSPTVTLLNPRVQDHRIVRAKGVVFSVADQSVGNSLVIFRPTVNEPCRAGQIQRIFVHSRPTPNQTTMLEFFFVVKAFIALTEEEATRDPYRKFPLVDVKLYRDTLGPSSYVTKTTDIVSHFACYPYRGEGFMNGYQVVLSLDRVSLPGFMFHGETN